MNTQGEGADSDGDGRGTGFWADWQGDGYVACAPHGDLNRQHPGELLWLVPSQQLAYEDSGA